MSGKSNKQVEQITPAEQPGLIESIKDGIQAVAPGLSLSKLFNDVGSELKQQVAHGAHEAAAALFNGSAYVMYPRAGHGAEDQQHGLPTEAVKQPEIEQDQSRGGMEM